MVISEYPRDHEGYAEVLRILSELLSDSGINAPFELEEQIVLFILVIYCIHANTVKASL